MFVPYYEAVYRDEEPGERMAAWELILWDFCNAANGAKGGKKIRSFPPTETGGADAMAFAEKLNNTKKEIDYA